MELLAAMNICLRAVNEEAVSDTQTESYLVAQLEPLLESVRRRILMKGHPFNIHTVTLAADANGVQIPAAYLAVRWPESLKTRLSEFNGKVYDKAEQGYWTDSLTLDVVLDISFAQIPEVYAEWIAREAAVEFEVQVHGLTPAYHHLRTLANYAKQTALNSEFVSIDGMAGFVAIQGAFNG